MKKQKELSKKSLEGDSQNIDENIWKQISNELQPTNFLDMKKTFSPGKVLKIVFKGDTIKEASQINQPLSLIFDQIPFMQKQEDK